MQMIEVSKLIPHPRNKEFFDNIEGDKWEDFKKSIIRRGVVEGIVLTQDLMVVSGHQRVRACKELGILEVPCRITHYPDKDEKTGNSKEDLILEDLISTNIIQRGIGNVNPMKMAKCIVELERIYGIYNGNHKIKEENNLSPKTQDQLAYELGMTDVQLRNYKKLTTLIPEIQELVENNKLKATTAYKIYAKLSPEEQEQLFNEIGKDKIPKLTQKETEKLVNEIKELQNKNDVLTNKLSQLDQLQQKIKEMDVELSTRPEIEKEVEPEDYQEVKRKLQDSKKYYSDLKNEYDNKIKQLNELKQEINALKSVTEEEKYAKKLKDSAIFFCARVNDFIEKTGGFVWLSENINELPEFERNSYIKAIEMVENWATAMKMNMKKYI